MISENWEGFEREIVVSGDGDWRWFGGPFIDELFSSVDRRIVVLPYTH